MELIMYTKSGWRRRKSASIETADNKVAYHVDFPSSKNIVVHRGGPQGPVVGRVEFHTFKTYIEIWFEDNTRVKMVKDGIFGTSHVVDLPAAPPTSPFKWKALFKLMELYDSKGQLIAMHRRKSALSSKAGILTLAVTGISQPLMDQVVVTMLAYEEKLRKATAAQGAAGGAAMG